MTTQEIFDGTIVLGLGTMGSMTAWRLAARGEPVLGIEQFGAAHARGAAAGESRLFRTAYHEGAHYVPILRAARRLWTELEQRSGRELLLPCGVLSIGSEDAGPMRRVWQSVLEGGIDAERLDSADLHARFPQHAPVPGEIGILDREGGVLRSESAVLAALGEAQKAGATLSYHERVLSIEDALHGVTVTTDRRRIRARGAVVTAGPWSAELLGERAAVLSVRPLVLTWFHPHEIASYTPERFPAFIRDTEGMHLFGAPTLDGASIKVSVSGEWAAVPAPDAVHRWLDEAGAALVSERVARLLPGVHPEPTRFSVHLDGYTPDGEAMIGRPDGLSHVVVALGFSGHGFKTAPVIGDALAALAVGETPGIDLTRFDPDRFASV